jgi:hypothetical protein
MIMIAGIAYALWAAFWWRVRGGAWETLLGLPPATTQARLVTAAALAVPLLPVLGWTGAAPAVLLFLGMALAGWGDAMDIGRLAGTRLRDAVDMSAWGLVATAPAAGGVLLLGGTWWSFTLAGLAFGPVYAAAWWWAEQERLPHPAIPRFAVGPTEWAECGAGAAIGLALLAV